MGKTEYSRILANFGGIDVTSDDSNVALNRSPYMINMWRDFKSENGAAIETFPGWRKQPFSQAHGRINGLYSATFDSEDGRETFILIHQGNKIFYVSANDKDNDKASLKLIGTCANTDSNGFQHGNAFYLMDGEQIVKISLKSGQLQIDDITESAYVPTTYFDGAEYEQRNLLTNDFYNKYNVNVLEEIKTPGTGITFMKRDQSLYEGQASVTAIDSDLDYIYIPASCVIDGEKYNVATIEDGVGNGSNARIVIAPYIAGIGSNSTSAKGCFTNCNRLERVILESVVTIGDNCFVNCENLAYVGIGRSLVQSKSTSFTKTGTNKRKVLFGGTKQEISTSGLLADSNKGISIETDCKFLKASIDETVNVDLPSIDNLQIRQIGSEYGSIYSYSVLQGTKAQAAITVKNVVGSLILSITGTTSGSAWTQYVLLRGTSDDASVVVNDQETAYGFFRFDLYEPTQTVYAVDLAGEELEYAAIKSTEDGKTYIKAITVYEEKNYIRGKLLTIFAQAYDSEFSRSTAGEDYMYGNAGYEGTSVEAILKCTLWAEYDGRIFLAGNPNLPNTVFYSNRNLTGVNDPTYFGQLNFFNDGQGTNTIASLLATPSFLAVIKRDSGVEGTVYYHTPQITEYDVLPKIYPSTQGAANVGSLGPAINFRDDPVFVSAAGLEAISLSTVNSERGLYHRSTNIDKWLLAEISIGKAEIVIWEGYLVILCNGKIFMADSRQVSKVNGVAQYEWYFIADVGTYEGQTLQYFFPSASPYLDGVKLAGCYINGYKLEIKEIESECSGEVQSEYPTTDEAGTNPIPSLVQYTVEEDEYGDEHYYIVSSYGEMIGGEFKAACKVCVIKDELWFGTESGAICVVNTDKRGESVNGEPVERDRIHYSWYTRCGRRYPSGFSTKKDNCDIPYYDKDTVGKSLVIKAKTMQHSTFEVKVRSDRETWQHIQSATDSVADSYDVDFSNTAFTTSEETIRQFRDRSRRWVEKQYYLVSEGYKRPFGIYSIAYRYVISGLNGRIRRK